MENYLEAIETAVEQTSRAISSVEDGLDDQDPQLIVDIAQQNNIQVQGVSLLTLKNHALLSYLENSILVVLSRLEEIRGKKAQEQRNKAVQNTVTQRVVLEKGVKPLEKKLNYQLDKMMRAYKRMEEEMASAEKSALNKSKKSKKSEDSDSDGSNESGSEDESESESEDENLNYKPDVQALAKKAPASSGSSGSSSSSSGAAYKPPKIAAVAPTDKNSSSNSRDSNGRKLQSMEEYLQENSDAPLAEASIGSTIVNHGKGGVKTAKEKEREREIQTYEETNFTRLPSTQTKKTFKQKQHELVNNFAGEDWSIFNNNRNIKDSTSRKRKPASAWDRAKKRKN